MTSDADSILEGSVSDQTESTTLNSSVLEYRIENGRTYHSYGSTQYYGPNDEAAQMNQDLSHHLYTLILGGKLIYAPVDFAHDVLDLGCGTGMWAIDFADAHAEATVKGIDLSPIQPVMVPPNCTFEVDDYNQDFLDEDKYDLVHQRELLATVPDWLVFYKKIFKSLKPGGWLDIMELDGSDPSYYSAANDDLPLPRGNPARDSNEYGNKAVRMMGLDLDGTPKIEGWLKEAGYVNIKVEIKKIPIGPWMEDKEWQEIGKWNLVKLQKGISDYIMRPYTMLLGSNDELPDICSYHYIDNSKEI
ncbi:hypothetical protein CJF32_00007262 [Rutstroemia sp. NJR-2017a WRK4]|nr:hypothetical protein CJF32_00007262 [Rutstroemia sp. NJR-2017a WRK4]